MTPSSLLTVAATGFAVAFLHAAMPTHWLPFVLVGRAQGWSRGRTLGVTAAAGTGHVLFTALIGLALTGAGLALAPHLGAVFDRAVGGLLVALGVVYLLRQVLRRPHSHGEPRARYASNAAATAGLVALLTFSPCEVFLPIYLANVRYGWAGFAGLSLVLAVATGLGMLLFTSLSLAGANRLRLERLEGYEMAIVGAVLCALGVFVALEG